MRGRIPGFLAVFAAALLLAASPAFAGGGGGGHGGGGGNKGKSSEFTAGEDGSRYITMAPMILPVLNDKGIEEIVSVVVSLEVKDQEKMESKAYRNGQFLDINRLKIKITSVTHTIVGHGEVDDVLIQGVNQRHFN